MRYIFKVVCDQVPHGLLIINLLIGTVQVTPFIHDCGVSGTHSGVIFESVSIIVSPLHHTPLFKLGFQNRHLP
jgi:hypothetical protein